MMPKLEYFLLAESVSTDTNTNRVSVFNILEEITVPRPGSIPSLVAVSSWNIAPEERGKDFQVTLRIPQPWEERKYEDFSVNFTAERSRHRMHHYLVGVPARETGDLTFEILLNGEHKASHCVTVHHREEDGE